jgi:hypothetical protein
MFHGFLFAINIHWVISRPRFRLYILNARAGRIIIPLLRSARLPLGCGTRKIAFKLLKELHCAVSIISVSQPSRRDIEWTRVRIDLLL